MPEPRRAHKKKATPAVDKEATSIQGVAKNLVDRLYGPARPPWGTTFTEWEDTVASIRAMLTEEMLRQALGRQAAQKERPSASNVCPGWGRPTPPGDLTEERGQRRYRKVA